jgi:hypothetical protein
MQQVAPPWHCCPREAVGCLHLQLLLRLLLPRPLDDLLR